MSVVARTGRHRQRYDNHVRLVAGCVPYRLKQNGEHANSLVDRLEILMISSPNRSDLVFPKGGWEDDETIEEAACREALEEAGIKGTIDKGRLGVWVSRSKSSENSCSLEGYCKCYIFAMEVTEELDSWPEQASHERIWLSVPDAWSRCRYPWMREALEECVKHLQCQDAISACDPPLFVKHLEPESIDNPATTCTVSPLQNSKLRVDIVQYSITLGPQPQHCILSESVA